jgi:hypothetical protein
LVLVLLSVFRVSLPASPLVLSVTLVSAELPSSLVFVICLEFSSVLTIRQLFVGMILILIFAEVLGLYGLIVALILNTRGGGSANCRADCFNPCCTNTACTDKTGACTA